MHPCHTRVCMKTSSSVILSLFFLFQFLSFFPSSNIYTSPLTRRLGDLSLLHPPVVDAAGLSSASATLSNPRLSFEAGVNAGVSAGYNTIVINTTAGANADINTYHLFPNDYIGVGTNPNLQVESIVDSVTFTTKTPLSNAITTSHKIYSTQSGTLSVNFYTSSAVPVGGSIEIDIPAANGSMSGSANDGTPDTTNVGSNGFDLNLIANTDTTCPVGFAVGTLTVGTSNAAPHKITCNWSNGTSALPAGANLTVVVGTAAKGLINPAPNLTSHTQGQADTYLLNVYTKTAASGGGSTIESVPIKIAPVEGVLVSASVDETLSFTIAGLSPAQVTSVCGTTPPGTNNVTTTAMSVPFGSSLTANTFYNAGQQLTVTTNAPGGYSVKVEENDQMGKDGKVCTGATAGESVSCIQDTTCDSGSCNESTYGKWEVAASHNGLGYSLANVSGSHTPFTYATTLGGCSGVTSFCAKSFPDQEASESKQNILSYTGVVNGDSACVLYRLNVSGTQPAGYYFNKVKYTASAVF